MTMNQRAFYVLCEKWALEAESVSVSMNRPDGNGKSDYTVLYAVPPERRRLSVGTPTGARSAQWFERTDSLIVRWPAPTFPHVETVVVFGPELTPRGDVCQLITALWSDARVSRIGAR